jgi:hypothetical protein
MPINVASMNAGQKLSYAQAVGSVKISSGSISSPVESFDVTLPSGYKRFIFEMHSVSMDPADTLAVMFSYDSGVSFLGDDTNFDTYAYSDGIAPSGNSTLVLASSAQESADVLARVSIDIVPGSASELTNIFAIAGTFNSGPQARRIFGFLDPAATVTPTKARATTMKVFPSGNDNNPPDSGNEILAAEWTLYGIG